LKQYIREKKLTVRVATLLLAQLLEGIAHINMNGIAHRSVWPGSSQSIVTEEYTIHNV